MEMCRQLNSYNGFPLEKVMAQGLEGPVVLLAGTVLTRAAAACRRGQGWSGTGCSPKHLSAGIWVLGKGCWEGRTNGRLVRQLGRLGDKTFPASGFVPPAANGSF